MNLRTGARRVFAAVLVTAALGAAGSAGAASLGGAKSKSLLAVRAVQRPVLPALLACDTFSLAARTGANLDGRPVQLPANCGTAVWTVIAGNWTIDSSGLRGNSGGATAVLNVGQTNVAVQCTMLSLNGGGRVAGVAIDHTGTTRTFLAAVLNGGNQLLLQLSVGGNVSTLATVTVTVPASTVLKLTRNGTAVTVSLDGVQKLAFTLTAAQVTTLAAGTKTGLYWSGGNTVRYVDVAVTLP